MEIQAVSGSIDRIQADAIIVYVFEGEGIGADLAAIDKALDGAITLLVNQQEIKGKLDETTVIHGLGRIPARKLAVVGLGKKADLTLDKVRSTIAKALRALRQKKAEHVATALPDVPNASRAQVARALAEGAVMGLYCFRKHITKEPEFGEMKQLTVTGDGDQISEALRTGKLVAEATNQVRDLANEPANYLTPTALAEVAVKLAAGSGLEVTVMEREQIKELGMGGLLGVSQGSHQPPKFIVLRYNGRASSDIDLALVGKGITFDSGGISIKPSEGMGEMKGDMAGAATVITALSAAARLKPKVNVISLAPATENLPGGGAYRPGDILTAITGKTMEIVSTDAEGRVILADALGYANKLGAKRIVDIATLTGACKVALGEFYTGAFSNSQELMDRVVAAGKEAGERIWQLPMHDDYKDMIKSDVADVKNTGGRWAGAITAAHFLAEFAGDTPWVHLDIAGSDMADKDRGYTVKGSTGVMVRTMINLVLSLAEE